MNRTTKEERFRLESEIISLVFEDNKNTVHFDYHVDIDNELNSIQLDLYTKNAKNNEIFLLHQTHGNSSLDVLGKMVDYLESNHQKGSKNSYTVKWRNLKDSKEAEHVSYFFEYSESDVLKKFFYNKNEADFTVSISLNPMA